MVEDECLLERGGCEEVNCGEQEGDSKEDSSVKDGDSVMESIAHRKMPLSVALGGVLNLFVTLF